MNLDTLKQLDLDDREISIYMTLFRLGPASIRDIAAQTGVNRGTTYETLKRLASRGIVSYFPKGKRRVFRAEDPERLLQLAEEKQNALKHTIEQLKTDIIPIVFSNYCITAHWREHKLNNRPASPHNLFQASQQQSTIC
ncbi:MAG: hypothetical protein B0D91_11755, partial [Oceanospirillales bacterium LUC14_002_19_P2]